MVIDRECNCPAYPWKHEHGLSDCGDRMKREAFEQARDEWRDVIRSQAAKHPEGADARDAVKVPEPVAHNDHPMRHWDRTCPACNPLAQRAEAAKLPDGGDARDYKAMWLDLIMQVGNKYPGESRHETAKRYILRAEDSGNNAAKCVSKQHSPAKEPK